MLARWMLSAIAVVCSLDSTASAAADPDRTRSLMAVLQSAAGLFDKACACQQLGEIGEKDAVPALAALLADSHLSAYARSGLERIPDPSAAEALRAAAATLKGDRLAGVVNSLGVLRDTKAVALLNSLAAKPESGVVEEALLALGRIAGDEAIQVLRRALADGAAASRPAAAAACLVAAEKELAEGRAKAAAQLCDAVRTAKVPAPCRAAAVRGAILARGSDGPALLIEQLRSDERIVRDVALMTIRDIPSDPLAGALNMELEREAAPELQIQLLWALVDCHNPRSISVVKTKTGHDDPRVRKTALEVLGQIGSTAEAGVFLKAIVDDRSADETVAALNCLERMEGAAIDAQIVKALASTTAGPRIQLIRLLDHRTATSATRELFKQAADPDVKVSVAALRALRSLADFGDLSALIALTLLCKDNAVREAAENAVVHVCTRTGHAAQGSEIVLTELRQTADPVMKISWMRILAGLGDTKAVPAILAATGDADESVAAHAIEQLGRWPDPSPVEDLLALVESDAAPVRRDRALGAAIRLATAAADEHQRPDGIILEWLRRAHQAVQTIAHRRLILSGLGRLKHIGSLRLLAPYLDDPELQNEAAVAIVQIAPDLRHEAPALLTEALEKIMATTKDPDLRNRAAEISRTIPGKPKPISRFDGRSPLSWPQRCVSTAVTQRLLEHSTPQLTTDVYTHVDPILRQAISQLPVADWV